MGIAHRTIRISRGNIAVNYVPRKAFPTALNTLGDRLYAVRFSRSILSQDVAERLGVSIELLRRWEHDLQMPNEAEWARIVEVFDFRDLVANQSNKEH